jgi:hypothetical protein
MVILGNVLTFCVNQSFFYPLDSFYCSECVGVLKDDDFLIIAVVAAAVLSQKFMEMLW